MKAAITILFTFFSIQLFGQTGPAGVGNNDGTSALKLWLDADKNVYADTLIKRKANDKERILAWKDLSGSKNDVFARTDSSRPTLVKHISFLNDCNAVRFTRNAGSNNKRNYMESKSFNFTNDITIYAVFYSLSKGGGNNFSPFKSNAIIPGNDTLWYMGAGIVDADVNGTRNDISMTLTDTSLAAGGGDTITKTEYTVKTPVKLNKANIGCLKKEMSSGKLSISVSTEDPAEFITGTQPINNSAKYTIGSISNIVYGKDVNFFDGLIASVMIFNKKLSIAETIILENYLAAKYNIPLAKNDIYKADDEAMGNYDFNLSGIGMGADGEGQKKAIGEGIIEISNPSDLGKEEFLLWASNNQSLSFQTSDFPEGVKQRIARTWRVSKKGETGKVDLVVNTQGFAGFDNQDLVLLIDTDNNGLFENEQLRSGMITQSKYLGNGKYLFPQVNLNNDNRFTFGILKSTCQNDCEAVFSPNGDGISDTYFIENVGKTLILDKFGQIIKDINAPGYWDGTKNNGSLAKEGLYFIIGNETVQKTVSLLK
ncbi:MAG: gliding motility-associated C-terminal domain-containing protein [Opitutaceae bacterium]|nr:gliding motility-associated C-terminal domain-containing protein [Cytophagales bacterium]